MVLFTRYDWLNDETPLFGVSVWLYALPFVGRSWRAMSLGVPAFAVAPRFAYKIWHPRLLVATLAPILEGYLGESSMEPILQEDLPCDL